MVDVIIIIVIRSRCRRPHDKSRSDGLIILVNLQVSWFFFVELLLTYRFASRSRNYHRCCTPAFIITGTGWRPLFPLARTTQRLKGILCPREKKQSLISKKFFSFFFFEIRVGIRCRIFCQLPEFWFCVELSSTSIFLGSFLCNWVC